MDELINIEELAQARVKIHALEAECDALRAQWGWLMRELPPKLGGCPHAHHPCIYDDKGGPRCTECWEAYLQTEPWKEAPDA